QIGLSDRHKNARRVLRWVQGQGKDEVSREEVRQYALGRRLDAEATQAVLDGLVKVGWLRLHVWPTKGRPAQRWAVNPICLGGSGKSGKSGKGVVGGLSGLSGLSGPPHKNLSSPDADPDALAVRTMTKEDPLCASGKRAVSGHPPISNTPAL